MPDSDREHSDVKTKDVSGGHHHDDLGLAMSSSASGQGHNGRQNLVKYGELVILGYNGQLPQGKERVFNCNFFMHQFFDNTSWNQHTVMKCCLG